MRKRMRTAAVTIALLASGTVLGQSPLRFVDAVEVNQRDSHVDVSLIFNCSLQYVGHTPASQGTELRVRLRPMRDCGLGLGATAASELAPLSGADGILSVARLEQDVPGELALTLTWLRPESFILAQSANLRGLRIRLLNRSSGAGQITVLSPGDVLAIFAINLESRPEPFDEAEIARAASLLQLPAFVSTIELDGQRWHRLRVGPIDRRSRAEQALRTAATHYPRAWLAIGDDARTSDPNVTADSSLPAVERIGADPPLESAERRRLLTRARKSLSARDLPEAIVLLTKLQRQPEFPERAQVQELLALARERSGQLAHAKAEYEEYLLRYPTGAAAERVRLRLRILRTASADGRSAGGAGRGAQGWSLTGGFAQLYRRDESRIDESGAAIDSVNQSALFNDGSLLARRRGDRMDLAARANLAYVKDLLPEGPGDQIRVSTAWLEWNDRLLGLGARFGRQPRSSAGVLGSFDGLALSYELRPGWSLEALGGMPVESSRDGPNSRRRLAALSLGFAPDSSSWDASAFISMQRFDGVSDRQAAGFELSYFVPGRSLVGMIDYDLEYSSLNAAVLVGTLQLPARWTVSFDLERRNAPVLTTRNALIGQPVDTLTELLGTFTEEEVLELARDRTSVLSSYSVSATRPLGERFHIAADVIASELSGTPASGGIAEQPATGLDLAWQAQLFATGLIRAGDFNVLAVRYEDSARGKLSSVSLTSRMPLFSAWRISSRLRVDERRLDETAMTERLYVPSLRLDYQRNRRLFELEAGVELGRSDQGPVSDDSRRFFVGIGYRVGF